jgi:hypothetical protein
MCLVYTVKVEHLSYFEFFGHINYDVKRTLAFSVFGYTYPHTRKA